MPTITKTVKCGMEIYIVSLNSHIIAECLSLQLAKTKVLEFLGQ